MRQIEVSAEAPLPAPQPLSPGRTWLNLIWVSGAHAVIHAAAVLLPLVYPILHQTYGLSYTQIGLLITIPNLVGGLVHLAFGYLGRYLARKTMIGAGNMLVGLSLFLTGLASTFPGFLAKIAAEAPVPLGQGMKAARRQALHTFP